MAGLNFSREKKQFAYQILEIYVEICYNIEKRRVRIIFEYKINIDKKVLRLLGSQLYGDTPSIISELVQNAYDADAAAVWITLSTKESKIIVQDNGIGMTPEEVNSRFLNIGQDRRTDYPLSPRGRKVLGRKGIGKLAVFSLAKVVEVFSIKDGERAACRLDFDDITLNNGNPIALDEDFNIDNKFLSEYGTGTVIVLKSIQKDISRSLNYIVNRLVRAFDVNSSEFKIYIRKNEEKYNELNRADLDFFESMDTIITFGDEFIDKIDDVNKNSINEKYKYTRRYEELCAERKMSPLPYKIEVLDKYGKPTECMFSFSGWIGTIDERQSFKKFVSKNYSEDEDGNAKFEVAVTDNRITVFSRSKIGEFDILPKTQTNRIADAYVIGEIYADIFEDDNLADMAISNRRGYDEADQRYVNLLKIISDVVTFITRRKEDIQKKKKEDNDNSEAESVKAKFVQKSPRTQKAIKEKFTDEELSDFETELFQFGRALNLTSSTKKIFISHKNDCAEYGKFLVRCFDLIGLNVKESIIFTSIPELGVPLDKDIYDYLKDCFRDDLYVIFLFSKSFYNSNVCIAETGAAWATNQKYCNVVVDLEFNNIDKPINNSQIGVSLFDLSASDLIYKLTCLIKNALQNTGYNPLPSDGQVNDAIEKALIEYSDRLKLPIYFPNRSFLANPICPICGGQTKLVLEDDKLKYSCKSVKCKFSVDAEVLG